VPSICIINTAACFFRIVYYQAVRPIATSTYPSILHSFRNNTEK
jgi:hypothetical protein